MDAENVTTASDKEIRIGILTLKPANWDEAEAEARLKSAVYLYAMMALDVARKVRAEVAASIPPQDPDQQPKLDEVSKLPEEISISTFARFAEVSRGAITKMIRDNDLPARVVNPAAKRPTYRIPTSSLRRHLGLPDANAQ